MLCFASDNSTHKVKSFPNAKLFGRPGKTVITKLSRTSDFIGCGWHEALLFRARVHCYHCLYIIFSANPVRRSGELRGGPGKKEISGKL